MSKPKTIKIDDIEYVQKGSEVQLSDNLNGMKHAIIRTRSAGVFAGYIESKKDQTVVLLKARRIYQWAGAATLSQLSMEGTNQPKSCKFPQEVERVELFEVIEILDTTKKAKESLDSVPVWKV
jgi:hypothetical protein